MHRHKIVIRFHVMFPHQARQRGSVIPPVLIPQSISLVAIYLECAA